MDSNSSLDDFAGANSDGEDGEGSDAEDGGGGDEQSSDERPDATAEPEPPEPTPATPTYRWSPTGATCPRCGESVEQRWEDSGEFVCAECKDW